MLSTERTEQIPVYLFYCKKCKDCFEEICNFEESNSMKCTQCNSKRVERMLTAPAGIVFAKPQESSKWDNFEYRAGFNMEKAKKERMAAEAVHKGPKPYRDINDTKDGTQHLC